MPRPGGTHKPTRTRRAPQPEPPAAPTKPTAKKRGSGAGGAVPPEKRARVVELATTLREDGTRWSVRAIAAEVGVAATTVRRIVKADGPEGFTWEGALTPATAARVADGAARRAAIAERYLAEAERILDRLSAPHESIHWDKDGFMHRGHLDGPLSGDVRNYAIALGILTDKHLQITRADGGDADPSAVDAWHADVMGEKPAGVPW